MQFPLEHSMACRLSIVKQQVNADATLRTMPGDASVLVASAGAVPLSVPLAVRRYYGCTPHFVRARELEAENASVRALASSLSAMHNEREKLEEKAMDFRPKMIVCG